MGKRNQVTAGFTLLEVLIALGLLVSCLALLAAAFTRHLELLQRIERSLAAHALADREIVREAVERREGVSFESGAPAGYSVRRRKQTVELEVHPLERVEMEQVTASSSWSFRGREYTEEVTAGLRPSQETK